MPARHSSDASAVLMVGLSAVMIEYFDQHPLRGPVILVEEPHVIEARGLATAADRHPSLAQVIPGPVQSSDGELPDAVLSLDVGCVLPGGEYSSVAAAVYAERFGLPGAGVRAASTMRDKAALRAAADGHLAQPEWATVDGPDEVAEFAARHPDGLVLKPANRQASLGVQLLTASDDLAQAWQHLVDADEPWLAAPGKIEPRYLVEERMRGQEYSFEALVGEGRLVFHNLTQKTTLPGRHPVEGAHLVPAPVPDAQLAAFVDANSRLVEAVGFRDGMLHSEWIWRDGSPWLVECAGRMPGDRIPDLISLAWEFDFFGSYVEMLMGSLPDGVLPTVPVGAAAIRFAIRGDAAPSPEQLRQAEDGLGVVHVASSPAQPKRASTMAVTSSWGRTGYAIATGAAAEEAEAAAAEAVRVLEGGDRG